ncbi:hypothetical protein MyNCGM121_36430 [Achromobacter xylosoxidans]
MTQQDDITQRVLTDEQIQALWDEACKDSPQAPGWNRHIRFARALLSQVRAPVADERAAVAYLDLGAGGYMDVGTDLTDEQLAALPKGRHMLAIIGTHGVNGYTPASAPVADRQRLRELVDAVWNEATESTAVPDTPWADRLIDKVYPLLAASAPVAGEAQGWSGWACQYPNKLPRLYGSKEIARLNCDAANGDRVLFLSEHAAPQASAEDVRNAALEEAAKLMDQTLRSNGAALIRGLKRSQADKDGGQQRAGDAALARLAEPHTGMRVDYQGLLRQAREGLHDSPGLAEMLRQLQGHLRELGQRWYAGDTAVVDELLQLYCVESNARAALSATQAEQGERDE